MSLITTTPVEESPLLQVRDLSVSFLGLGVQAPTPEWGAMLNEAKNVMVSNPEQMIVPGLAVVVLVGACNMLGDCLRDALDPKAVRQ